VKLWPCDHAQDLVAVAVAVAVGPGPGGPSECSPPPAEAAIGHSLLSGYEDAVFSGILGVAVLFEVGWYVGTSSLPVTPLAA
jgi:hypothetical protein